MTDSVYSIAGLNNLPEAERLDYARLMIPLPLLQRYQIDAKSFADGEGRSLLNWVGGPGRNDVEVSLYHQYGAPDPLIYFHLTDTTSMQIHVLLTVINDPDSPRFDVDRMPDGSKTHFGIFKRNVEAEVEAFKAGLAPGQIRRGLRVLRPAMEAFEAFVTRLGHDIYFVEPLQYHNAVIFERYGFAYQQGRRWMQSINTRFTEGSFAHARLDSSTIFRRPEAAQSIRGRSWAIHDGILGEPYTGVTMYKRVGRDAGVSTYPESVW
ncbi:MAG TPA: hypothetical protein VJ020_10810 [Anaerolineales bacterium]|nr:hypothetical protein [Anaerolineales bacterium]